jgi:uncharacterized membrane protein
MPPLAVRTGTARFTDAVNAMAAAFREHGAGLVLWPIAIGAALAASALEMFGPESTQPHAFPLSTHPVLLGAAFTAVVCGVASAAAVFRRRRSEDGIVALYERAVRIGVPLVALPFGLVLREPIERAQPLAVLCIAALSGALTSYAAYRIVSEREATASRIASIAAALTVAACMAVYSVAASRITITNHLNFNTGRSDLGYYLSIFRQSSQGHLLGCSLCGGGSHLTGHFDPILVLLSPLFLIYPYAETLLVLQTVWLASGAIPVYLLARHHLQHRAAAVALSVTYLAYPALHGVNFFDFHSVALCIPLFIWLLYCLERGYRVRYYVALALLLLVREDIPIALSCVGLYAIFSNPKERARTGWATIAISFVYFLTVKALFMHRVDPLNTATGASGGYAYYYEAMIPSGRSTAALVGTLVTNPTFVLAQVLSDEKVEFILKLLVPLFGLPLLARGRLLLAYGSALTLLASRTYLFSIHFQYTSLLIPFLFVLAITAQRRLYTGEIPAFGASGPRLARALSFGMLVTTLLCSWKFGAFIENASFMGGFRALYREDDKDHRDLAAWLKVIARTFPRGARVAGNSRIITHLGPVTSLDLLEHRTKADYVVINVESKPFGPRILKEAAEGNLTLIASHGKVNVYKAHYKTHIGPEGAGETE